MRRRFTFSRSECLLFYANSAIYQLYYGENKLLCNEDGDVGFVLDQRSYFGSLQWPTETTVDMWLHSDTIS